MTSTEVQEQINTLREAFSADTSKPFELKPTLGLRSPTIEKNATPPMLPPQPAPPPVPLSTNSQSWGHLQTPDSSKTISPASEYGQAFDGSHVHDTMTSSITSHTSVPYHSNSYDVSANAGYTAHNMQPVPAAVQQPYALEPVISNEQPPPVWDPSGIFNQWNTAFGGPAQSAAQPSPPDPRLVQPTSSHLVPHNQQQPPVPQSAIYGAQSTLPSPATQIGAGIPAVPTVTPVMWQDAFTSAYVSGHGGQKRFREGSLESAAYNQYTTAKRRG